MEEGIFPHSRSLLSEGAMEEERRLCYVGMTRAEKRLYLTWARYRRRFGGSQPEVCLPSRFLNEVPVALREKLSPYSEPQAEEVDLFAEQSDVRESVKRNLYTGKTYNSVENIAQFFAERGMPPPSGFVQKLGGAPKAAASPSPTPTPEIARAGTQPRPAAPPTKNGPVPASSPSGRSGGPPPGSRPMSARPVPARGVRSGATIQHPKYGRGVVLRREGDGEDAKLTISFPGHGLKKIVEKYAGIKVEE
jgi:DNA helicase-2/ATP-dependent DNA helicase PcrA